MPSDLSIRFTLSRLLLVLALLLSAGAYAAEGGKFMFVTGDVKILSADGKERVAAKGDSFNTGDTILTGASGTAQLLMRDGGKMAIRANTQLKLDQYIFNGREDGQERSLLSLVKGGFRTITGLIGNTNKDNYKIVTPNATIGIRGTDHEPVVVPPGAAGGFQAGTYDRVYRGATIIETEKGKLIVNPNQVGFTPGKGAPPVILPKLPEFYDTKPQQLSNVPKDADKTQDSSGDTSRKSDATTTKSDSVRSLSNAKSLKDVDSSDLTTIRTPLDTSATKDVGTTTLKSDALKSTISTDNLKSLSTDTLTTPITDTSRATTTTIDTSVSTVKTDALTTPTTTLKSTTVSPAAAAVVAPVTTTVSPVTTTISPAATAITAPVTKSIDTVTVPTTTTIQKSLITR